MVTVKMPKKGESIYFKNFYKKYPVPFVIYADFECFTKPVLNCKPDPSKSYNIEYQKHEPSGFCFYLKGVTGRFKTESFTKEKEDDDVAAIFVNKIVGYTQSIYTEYYRKPKLHRQLDRGVRLQINERSRPHGCQDGTRYSVEETNQFHGQAQEDERMGTFSLPRQITVSRLVH